MIALPEILIKFLQENNIPIEYYSAEIPRYVRVNKKIKFDIEKCVDDLKLVHTNLPDVFSLEPAQKIAHTHYYKHNLITGIDMASVYAVESLDVQAGEHILDFCCAPGAKLSLIADKIMIASAIKDTEQIQQGSVTGVDINTQRMQVCRSIVKKWGISKSVRLFNEDAVHFNKLSPVGEKYDKAIVDAECTHEGCIKNLLKFNMNQTHKESQSKAENIHHHNNKYIKQQSSKNEWSLQDFEERFFDPVKLQNLHQLQYNLLCNAFSLVKKFGVVVYSTCSFTKAQNEDIIAKFVGNHQCELVEPFEKYNDQLVREGKFVKLNPIASKTKGLFIAKIMKLAD